MEKPARYKSKNKKPATKPKTTKKRQKSDGPGCSMFLAELTKKLAAKRREEEEAPRNVVHNPFPKQPVIEMIIDSITNALPFKFSKRSPEAKASPIKIETLQTFAPELLPNDTLNVPHPLPPPPVEAQESLTQESLIEISPVQKISSFRMPRMPVVSSEVMKQAVDKRKRSIMQDASVNTGTDLATEIQKYVSTLKRISLIAEEFNQKTAKNLKEIVDSVQEDLIKKLEEIKIEQPATRQQSVVINDSHTDRQEESA